jgi:hypothetical protein
MKSRAGSLGRSLVVLALALAVITLGQTVALAEGDEAALVLAGHWQASGVLAGSPAGSFESHEIAYPGGEEELVIVMVYSPRDPSYASAIGFNLYEPDGAEHRAAWVDEDGVLRLTYAAEEAATLLIQVYNYAELTVGYDLAATGVGAPAGAPAVAEAAAEATNGVAAALDERATGAIVGNTGGAFAAHTVSYAGDESTVTVTLTYAPADPSFTGALGFVIYSPSGAQVAAGAPGDTHEELTASLVSDEAGAYIIQVFNYTDGVLMTYSLTAAH